MSNTRRFFGNFPTSDFHIAQCFMLFHVLVECLKGCLLLLWFFCNVWRGAANPKLDLPNFLPEILSSRITLSPVNDKKLNIYNFNTTTPIMAKFIHEIATMHGASWWTQYLPLTNPRWRTSLNFAKCTYFRTRWRYLQPIWYKDATWTDYGQQLHWRQLSAYNVVESVATNTTSRCIFCIFDIFCFVFVDSFCCNCLLAHLSVEVGNYCDYLCVLVCSRTFL